MPAITPVPSYLGQAHPSGPGVDPLPSPPGLELVGIADAEGVVQVQISAFAGALPPQLVARLTALWERYRRAERPKLRRLK